MTHAIAAERGPVAPGLLAREKCGAPLTPYGAPHSGFFGLKQGKSHKAMGAKGPHGAPHLQAGAEGGGLVWRALKHDAKKWEPVFRKIMRPNKNLAQNADSDFLHFALEQIPITLVRSLRR